jgi:hypothetical protein
MLRARAALSFGPSIWNWPNIGKTSLMRSSGNWYGQDPEQFGTGDRRSTVPGCVVARRAPSPPTAATYSQNLRGVTRGLGLA